jgi:hypothetical protein
MEAWNGVRNGEKRKHPKSLAKQIKAYTELILLHLAKTPTIHRRRETPSTLSHLSLLPAVTTILHVDAVLFSSSTKMEVGVVIRANRDTSRWKKVWTRLSWCLIVHDNTAHQFSCSG